MVTSERSLVYIAQDIVRYMYMYVYIHVHEMETHANNIHVGTYSTCTVCTCTCSYYCPFALTLLPDVKCNCAVHMTIVVSSMSLWDCLMAYMYILELNSCK